MIKNKLYVYGVDDTFLQSDLHFGKHMLQRCKMHGENVALIDADSGKKMTYAEFTQQAVDIALSLKRLGVGVGDVVSICSEKRMEFMPTLVGIVCTGATFAAADIGVKDEQILYRLKIIRPKVMFMSKLTYERYHQTLRTAVNIEHIIVYADEDLGAMTFKDFLTEHAGVEEFEPTPVKGWSDIAVIQFSSGTGGLPKAAKFPHMNFTMAVLNSLPSEKIYKNNILLSTREWCYTFGLYNTLTSLHMGAAVVFTLKNEDEDYLEAIDKHKVKRIQIVPTTISSFAKSPVLHQYDVSSLEEMYCSSIPINLELISSVKIKFPNLKSVSQIYGMTEAGGVIQGLEVKGNKMGSVGVACKGTVIKVVDLETRQAVGPYQRGEICFKSLSLMSGYIGDGDFAYLDEEGFFKSGDVGFYDDDKHFYIVDRLKELIKYRGCTLSPAEVENVFLKHPSIREVGVTSLPFSEAPIAFIVAQPECTLTEEDVTRFLKIEMPSVAMSGGIRFVDKLPRGAGTKLNRKALRNMI